MIIKHRVHVSIEVGHKLTPPTFFTLKSFSYVYVNMLQPVQTHYGIVTRCDKENQLLQAELIRHYSNYS